MKQLKIGGFLILITLLLQLLARNLDGFGEWYVRTIYPFLVNVLARFFGKFPFSVVETGIYLLIIFGVIFGIKNRHSPMKIFGNGILIVAILLLLYTTNCGINYYGHPFSYHSSLAIEKSDENELYQLCEYLTEQVNESYIEMCYDPDWNQEGIKAMKRIGSKYPVLSGYYPNPKGVWISKVLSVQQLGGIYSPFTIEANYNKEMTSYNIPHTICHELSHLRGFMREDEANFIAYLACIGSDRQEYRYSGYLTGWLYATNALAKTNYHAYKALSGRLDPRVSQDLKDNYDFWDKYEGRVAQTATKMNDTYLKINQQTDGVKSYGRAVDLMLAFYRDGRDS